MLELTVGGTGPAHAVKERIGETSVLTVLNQVTEMAAPFDASPSASMQQAIATLEAIISFCASSTLPRKWVEDMGTIAQKWHVLYTYHQQPYVELTLLMSWRNDVEQDSTKNILVAGIFSSKTAAAFWRHAEEYLAASGVLRPLEESIETLEFVDVKSRAMPVLEICEQLGPNDNDMAMYITTAISPVEEALKNTWCIAQTIKETFNDPLHKRTANQAKKALKVLMARIDNVAQNIYVASKAEWHKWASRTLIQLACACDSALESESPGMLLIERRKCRSASILYKNICFKKTSIHILTLRNSAHPLASNSKRAMPKLKPKPILCKKS